MAKTRWSVGVVITQFALACYFIITGLCLLGVGTSAASQEIAGALSYLRLGDHRQLVRVVLGVVILLCGVVLLVRFFWNPGVLDVILLVLTLIVWVTVAAVVAVSTFPAASGRWMPWFLVLSQNLLVIGGLLAVH